MKGSESEMRVHYDCARALEPGGCWWVGAGLRRRRGWGQAPSAAVLVGFSRPWALSMPTAATPLASGPVAHPDISP